MTIKGIKPHEPRPDDNDDEARHCRHDERQADRGAQRERELMCSPLEEWTFEQQRDLEYDVEKNPPAGLLRPSRAHRSISAGRQVNPFLRSDALGRPLQRTNVTTALAAGRISCLHEAVLRANVMGLVMGVFVTISWRLVGVTSDEQAAAARDKMLRRVREWSRKQVVRDKRLDSELAWIWVNERGPTVGLHTHLQFSCPEHLRTALLRVICRAVAPAPGVVASGAVLTLPGDTSAVSMSDRGETDRASAEARRQWTLFGYITKTPTVSYTPSRKAVAQGAGRVVGKRAGFSHHLLGGQAWERFTQDHDLSPSCVRDFLKTTAKPFPLTYGLYVGPIWDLAAGRSPSPHPISQPKPDAYPKTPDPVRVSLAALKRR